MSLRKKQIIALCICCTLLAVAIFQNIRTKKVDKDDSNVVSGNQDDGNRTTLAAEEFFSGARIERESLRSTTEEECLAVIANMEESEEEKANALLKSQSITMMNEAEDSMETAIKGRGYDDVFVLMEEDGSIGATVMAQDLDENEVMEIANIIVQTTNADLQNIVVKSIY